MDPNDRALTGFAMIGHATFHTYELVVPLFVVLWLDAFAVTPATLGLVVGAGYALIGVGALPAGILSDAYRSRTLIVGCLLGMGAGFVLLGTATNLLVLAVGLLVWGAAASVYHPAGLSLISRGAKARGTAFAYHGAAGNLGVAVGPFLGAILLAFFPWRTVAIVLVIPAIAAALVSLRLDFDETAAVDEAEPATDGGGADTSAGEGDGAAATGEGGTRGVARPAELLAASRALFTGGFAVVFAIAMLYGLYYRGAFTFLPEVLAGLALFEPATVAGREFESSQYVYAGLLMLGGAGQYVGGRLTDRVKTEHALLVTFSLLVVISLAFVPAANAGIGPLLVVCGLLGFVVYMEAPINQALIAKHVPADVHGLSFGYTYLGTFGVGALGASVAGAALTYGDEATLFAVLAVFAIGAVALGGYLVLRE